MSKKVTKCRHTGKKMYLCPSMDKYAEHNDTRKGLRLRDNIVDLKDPEWNMFNLGPYYRAGAKDPGVVFNFCPWCGSDLEKNWREPVRKEMDRKKAKKKKSTKKAVKYKAPTKKVKDAG